MSHEIRTDDDDHIKDLSSQAVRIILVPSVRDGPAFLRDVFVVAVCNSVSFLLLLKHANAYTRLMNE